MASVQRRAMAGGDAGVLQTLDVMAELISSGIDNPELVSVARRVAVGAGVRNQLAQASAIQGFLKSVWRFVDDPSDRELLRDPANMLREWQQFGFVMGDCDEAAVFGAALGKAVGLGASLTVLAFVGFQHDRYAHVFAELLTDQGVVVSLDVTKPAGPVPQVSRSLTIDV